MWPMLFSVPVLYANAAPDPQVDQSLTMMTMGLLTAILAWFCLGYPLIYDNGHIGSFWPSLLKAEPNLLADMCLQGAFFIYAAIMFMGTLNGRVAWPYFVVFTPLWLVLVYSPLAYLLWTDQGILKAMGALDFSGGLVVHLSAGLTSLILARRYHDRSPDLGNRPSDLIPNYMASFLIAFGWFGFNLGPLGDFSQQAPLIISNTVIAVLSASLGQVIYHYKHLKSRHLMTGMMVGLVTSTAGVAFLPLWAMLILAMVSGYLIAWALDRWSIHDPVDSFIINGLGGLIGATGLIFLAAPQLTPNHETGLFFAFKPDFIGAQVLALGLTMLITWLGTHLTLYLCQLIPFSHKGGTFSCKNH